MDNLSQSIRATFPRELREKPNWVTWQYEQRAGKATKVPYGCDDDKAKSTDLDTWSVFDQAANSYITHGRSGVGYVFDGDGVIGVDLDHAIEAGQFKPWAQEIITRLHTYTELSPSRTGLHIYLRGQLPGDCHKRPLPDGGAIEFYSSKRFFRGCYELAFKGLLSRRCERKRRVFGLAFALPAVRQGDSTAFLTGS